MAVPSSQQCHYLTMAQYLCRILINIHSACLLINVDIANLSAKILVRLLPDPAPASIWLFHFQCMSLCGPAWDHSVTHIAWKPCRKTGHPKNVLLLCNLILKWLHYLIINALGRRLKGQFALNQGLKLHDIMQSICGDSDSSWALPCLPYADKKRWHLSI